MNDTTHEQLSALMDGELSSDELRFLLRRVDTDATLVQRWSRMQTVRAVFKHEPVSTLASDGFAAAVMARLDEPAEVAVSARRQRGGRALRWAGGGAIAASVAVMALLASKPTEDNAGAATAAAAVPAVQQVAANTALRPSLPQQIFPAIDYTKPASFESIVPSYAPHYSSGQLVNETAEGFVPYVLLIGSRQAEPAAPATDAAARQ